MKNIYNKNEEKATSVDDFSEMNAVDAEFIPSYYKTKAALVENAIRLG